MQQICSLPAGAESKGDDLGQPPFAHFQTLEKQRKRRMSWIPKTGGSFDGPTGSQDLPGLVPTEKIEADQLGPVVAHLTREEKSKAKKEAEDYQEAGMSLGSRPFLDCISFPFGSLW